MQDNITSEAHITAAREAIENLVSEYETLDTRMTVIARGRRATAAERLSATSFTTVSEDLDPYNMDDLSDQLAGETLEWSLFVTDLLVTAMLDFRETAEEHRLRPEGYRDRLRSMLLDIWLMALEELQKTGDDDQEHGDAGYRDDLAA